MIQALTNLDAEAALLGSILQSNAEYEWVADMVTPDCFYEPAHKAIYDVIAREIALGRTVTPYSIKGYLDACEPLTALGGGKYLARLTMETGLIATVELGRILVELHRRRGMHAGLLTAVDACADLNATVAEIVSHVDEAISEKADVGIVQISGGQAFDALMRTFGEKDKGVTCGSIPTLDCLLGPMRPKQLIIGAGRPGMGKTALALSYALGAAKRGHGVLYVSLEMGGTELAARLAADFCFNSAMPIPYAKIRDGNLSRDEQMHIAEAARRMHALPFQVVDAGTLTVGRLNTIIRRQARKMAAQGHKLELVVVDYLQLMRPDSRRGSAYENVSEVSMSLKAMAKDNGVAVFALAQLSRSVESRDDKRPQLSDLKDSGQIEQDADSVLLLLRQEYYLKDEKHDAGTDKHYQWQQALEAVQGRIEFILAKRRDGVSGAEMGEFHGMYQAVRG